jgi:hypothetical protein
VEYILTTINEELPAAGELLGQSGALLVSINIKLAQGLQTVVFGWRYAGWSSQLSNFKPTRVCSAPAGRQVIFFFLIF